MALYWYQKWDNGIVRVLATYGPDQIEMNRISRWIWGTGASLDKVFNTGGGAIIKFQSGTDDNLKRAKLLTKIWRYCKKNNIAITSRSFPEMPDDAMAMPEDFKKLISMIKIF